VLVVMIPRADESLGHNAQQHPEYDEPKTLFREKNDQVKAKVGHKNRHWNAIFPMSKHGEPLVAYIPHISLGWTFLDLPVMNGQNLSALPPRNKCFSSYFG